MKIYYMTSSSIWASFKLPMISLSWSSPNSWQRFEKRTMRFDVNPFFPLTVTHNARISEILLATIYSCLSQQYKWPQLDVCAVQDVSGKMWAARPNCCINHNKEQLGSLSVHKLLLYWYKKLLHSPNLLPLLLISCPSLVPQIRPMADIVHFKYALTYLLK